MSGVILDKHGGVLTTMHKDASTGDLTVNVTQDVRSIIDENIANQNSGHDGYNADRSMRHYAEVPYWVIHKWMMDDGMSPVTYFRMSKGEKEAYIYRKCRDPEWRDLHAFWQKPTHANILHAKAK